MDMKDKSVLVFGSGISGIAASRLLEKNGANVILYDGNKTLDKAKIASDIGAECHVTILLGDLSEEVIASLDLLVLSPGVPTDLPLVEKMRARHIPIWGEVELAYTYGQGDVLAITGTNGKTTTTALLGEIMDNYKESVFVVGNIGNPYTSIIEDMTKDSVTVAEMSSFQLETIHTFHPKVSAILNISPDHLNRHHTMEAYIKAKEAIAANQTEDDTCVLNYEDPITKKFGEDTNANVLYFSSQRKLERGVYLDEGNIVYKDIEETIVCHISQLQLLGMHNYENIMAAVAMAAAYHTPMDIIRKGILGFKGVEHRIEYVGEKNGVTFYNDSKGTNPDAAIKGIQAMHRPTILIGGGYDKDSEYTEWIQAFAGNVKKLVLLGATKEKIVHAAKQCGFFDTVCVNTLEEAVDVSVSLAEPGDAVLLSPACASWDMFRSYEERGDKFKEFVNRL